MLAGTIHLSATAPTVAADEGVRNHCTVCGDPVRFGSRHHQCGSAVMQAAKDAHAAYVPVYRVRLKSRAEMKRDIPEGQRGWYVDVAGGSSLTVRDATPDDLARCALNGPHSKDPDDWFCEAIVRGALVDRRAVAWTEPVPHLRAVLALAAPNEKHAPENGHTVGAKGEPDADRCQACSGQGGTASGGPCAECYGQGTYSGANSVQPPGEPVANEQDAGGPAEREAFEAAMARTGWQVGDCYEDGEYREIWTQSAWAMWQARASLTLAASQGAEQRDQQ